MSDTERLAALLEPLIDEVYQFGMDAAQAAPLVAARLIAAGVTCSAESDQQVSAPTPPDAPRDCGCPEAGHYVDCPRSWYEVLRPADTNTSCNVDHRDGGGHSIPCPDTRPTPPDALRASTHPFTGDTPTPPDALCGAILTCALPILHDGDHERADGIRWAWPTPPDALDVERLAVALWDVDQGNDIQSMDEARRIAGAVAEQYAATLEGTTHAG